MVNGLNRVPGLRCAMPDGAFYAWCNVSGLGQPAAAIAEQWIDEAMVITVPGDGFGSPDYVRCSFATSPETIDEGVKRLERWASQRQAAPASRPH
jgi:aspartate/methionine/tyrosine aminotransferase